MRTRRSPICCRLLVLVAGLGLMLWSRAATAGDSLAAIARDVRPKVVKIYGAGGMRGLEAYQSGMLVSAEGHVLTAWSYVLDSDDVAVVLDDGRRYTAEYIGSDPLTEVAVLKIDAGKEKLPHFNLRESPAVDVGVRVLAFSNLFGIATGDEPVSMLQGYVSAVAPLEARRGGFSTNYRGDVYIVDAATNNPGASGGALVDGQGRLVGMLGKELRSELTGTWLNYAFPTSAFAATVEAIEAGDFKPPPLTDADRPDHPQSLAELGIVLVPEVVSRTPPYVDRVLPDSLAAKAGLRPDDLIVMVNTQVVSSRRETDEFVARLERDAPVRISVLRDEALLEFPLSESSQAEPGAAAPAEDEGQE
ncbi:MAG: S1C family serine protease [Pirellulales bacterium]